MGLYIRTNNWHGRGYTTEKAFGGSAYRPGSYNDTHIPVMSLVSAFVNNQCVFFSSLYRDAM
jgi:hypothetical protein